MKLPGNTCCPNCGTQLYEAIQDIISDDFHCPTCGSEMSSLKEEWETRLSDFHKAMILVTILNQCQPEIADEEIEKFLEHAPFTIEGIVEFLEKQDVSPVQTERSREQVVQASFRSALGNIPLTNYIENSQIGGKHNYDQDRSHE